MSQFNLRYVPTLSAGEFILNGQRFNTQGANINGNMTTALTTEVIINDQTKNQALYANILALEGEVSGNVNPNLVVVDARLNALEANVFILQGEMNAVEGNITILQGNVNNLQSQINVLSGNVAIDEQIIGELVANTQFLRAPYAGLVGNTSYFVNGLQMWSGADENGNGLYVYKDGGTAGLSQIRMRVEDNKNILVEGGSQLLKPKSTGNVSIKNTDGNFQFLVGDRNTANFQSLSQTEVNGDIRLKGQDNSYIQVYTQPATVVPPAPSVKRVDIRGDQELRLYGAYAGLFEDGGASVVGQNGNFQMTGDNGGYFNTGGNSPAIFAPGGSSPGSIDLQIGQCDLNTTGKINIGTNQGLTELGFKEINIGQSGPPAAARKSSTFIHGDMYMDYGGIVPPNTGLWDLLLYQGLPTIYSGPTNAPVKTTVNPYFRSISTFAPDYTNNSFIQTTGTFTVQVGAGAIVQNCGVGGYSISCLGGAVGITALVGGVLVTTAAGAIQMTTGAGAINMTTGAAPIQMETNIGDVLIKAGYAFDSTPELSLGSIYLQARDYTYITPDKNVVVGAGIEAPFNAVIANTIDNTFFGNLLSPGTITGNVVKSNVFLTPNVKSSVVNPLIANLYYQGNIIGQTGQAQASLFYGNGTIYTLSEIATVPYYGLLAANGNLSSYEPTKFTFNFTDLPINANMFYEVAPIQFDPNITNDRYAYGTWQSNVEIQSNISILLNAFIEPPPPTYDRYLTVLGNASFQSDVECNSNIIVQKDAFPLLKTELTNNSIFTSGDITCQTLNYTTLNPPIVIPNVAGGVESIIAGNNITISPLNGQGNVIINAVIPAGVNSIIAGNGIEISPLGGQGNVTVQLAGSVIPPGGYLPISGGIMTGEIHQYPSTGNLQENTYKLYRPQSSYQPPFPSIGPPTFDGELLTFYNGDNSPTLNYFTGWFTQDTFQYEPDVITKEISVSGGPPVNFYSSSGGSPTTGQYISTPISQFRVGDHLIAGQMTVIAAQVGNFGATLAFYTGPQFDPGSPSKTLLFQVKLTGFPSGGSGGVYNIPIDYVYLGGQKAVNWMEIQIPNDYGENNYITINTIGGQNWEGFIQQNGTLETHFVAVQGDATTSVLYEYFPSTGLTSKLLAFSKGPTPLTPPKIYGIYCDDVDTTRTIIIYGDFFDVLQGSTTIPVNYIFMYNIDTNTVIPLRTSSTDPNFPNGSTGLQDVVFGVDKQLTLTSAKKVWIWGAYNNVNPMGNLSPPSDSPIPGSSINFTTTDDWTNFVSWGTSIDAANKLATCVGGGKIMYDDPNNLSTFVLLVFASTRNAVFVGTIVAVTTNGSSYSSNSYAFPNGLFSTLSPAQPPQYISIVNTTAFITGKISGLASDGVSDVQFYSIVATNVGNFWNGSVYNSNLRIVANSTDAAFWNTGGLLETTRVAGMSNGTVVIGSEGYGVENLGGGVLTFPIANVNTPSSPATKYTITNINPYNVRNIVGNTANAVQLGCSLNQNNFWFGQTFDSTLQPLPPTIPTVNAINGAKFLVDSYMMDKIVFSGNIATDYASVSFIAGNAQNDKNWYWYSQVGAIDYFSGNTFYPNITSSGIGGSQNLIAGENITISGNVISISNPLTANINLASFSINGNSIGQLNMTLDSTGLYQIDNFTDSSNLDNQSLVFVNNTNQQLVQVSSVNGFGMEDSTGSVVGVFTNTAMVLSNVVNNSSFGIEKFPFDANITSTTGNINISTPGNISISSNVDFNNKQLFNVSQIISSGDLIINPAGSIETGGSKLNMGGSEIDQIGKLVGANNTDIELDANGTGDVLIKTATITRITFTDTGNVNFQSGAIYNPTTNTFSNVADPSLAQDVATKNYVDTTNTFANVLTSGNVASRGLSMNNFNIGNVNNIDVVSINNVPYPPAYQRIFATGGDSVVDFIENGRTYRCHRFTTTGPYTLTVSNVLSNAFFDFVLIGGGGNGGATGGGGFGAGGGGAGCLIVAYECPINAISNLQGTVGTAGQASSLFLPSPNSGNTISATFGATGGNWNANGSNGAISFNNFQPTTTITLGSSGGGGGGAGGGPGTAGGANSFATTIFTQSRWFGGGKVGGAGFGSNATAGGGGGVVFPGAQGSTFNGQGGNGGSGYNLFFDGTYRPVCGGGGGGGGSFNAVGGFGGSGVGGAGGGNPGFGYPTPNGGNAVANTGSGGGGGWNTGTAGNGATGLVMIRYIIG